MQNVHTPMTTACHSYFRLHMYTTFNVQYSSCADWILGAPSSSIDDIWNPPSRNVKIYLAQEKLFIQSDL